MDAANQGASMWLDAEWGLGCSTVWFARSQRSTQQGGSNVGQWSALLCSLGLQKCSQVVLEDERDRHASKMPD